MKPYKPVVLLLKDFKSEGAERGGSKVVAQEDPELTSSHRHTKSAATYG